jgi:hypothetical protein
MNANTMFYVGLDLGQSQDPAAIAVVERLAPRHGESCSILVRHLERAALGTPYPRIVARVWAIVNHKELRGRCALAVDGRGLGAGGRHAARGRAGLRAFGGDDHRRRTGTSGAGALLRELMDVKMSWPGGSGNLRMGADGYGEHDDLVRVRTAAGDLI